MKHLLLAKGLWGLIDGTEEVLANDAINRLKLKFSRRP